MVEWVDAADKALFLVYAEDPEDNDTVLTLILKDIDDQVVEQIVDEATCD